MSPGKSKNPADMPAKEIGPDGGTGGTQRAAFRAKKRPRIDCPARVCASSFLDSLGLTTEFFDAAQDRCYCERCAEHLPSSMPQCSQIYELPHGYVGFGIQMSPRAVSLRIFEKWPVSYHGLKAANLASVLNEGGLLLPGDTLLDGTTLKASHTRGEHRHRLYTSPSIHYAEKPVYTEPILFEEHRARIVLQCRQKPDFEVCGETIGWERDHPGVAISKHFKNSELEWFTTKRAAIIPYRILIKMETPKYQMEGKWFFDYVKWFFDEHGSWAPFDPAGEQVVETAHVAGHISAQSSFFNPHLQQNILYHYDLTKMQQINTVTKWTRPIKRVDTSNPVAYSTVSWGHGPG